MTNKWQYAYPDQVLRLNPAEDAWEYEEPEKQIRYDILKEKWFSYYLPPKNEEAKKEEALHFLIELGVFNFL